MGMAISGSGDTTAFYQNLNLNPPCLPKSFQPLFPPAPALNPPVDNLDEVIGKKEADKVVQSGG